MAPAHTTVFLSQKPSTKNGIIVHPAIRFLAWWILFGLCPAGEVQIAQVFQALRAIQREGGHVLEGGEGGHVLEGGSVRVSIVM